MFGEVCQNNKYIKQIQQEPSLESNLQHNQLSDACEILELNVLGAL